jgi:hypothetical protein
MGVELIFQPGLRGLHDRLLRRRSRTGRGDDALVAEIQDHQPRDRLEHVEDTAPIRRARLESREFANS